MTQYASGKRHNPFWHTTQSLRANDTIPSGKRRNPFGQMIQIARANAHSPFVGSGGDGAARGGLRPPRPQRGLADQVQGLQVQVPSYFCIVPLGKPQKKNFFSGPSFFFFFFFF